jgi:hypothetical protein
MRALPSLGKEKHTALGAGRGKVDEPRSFLCSSLLAWELRITESKEGLSREKERKDKMRNSVALCLMVLLGVVFPLPAGAQPSLPAGAVTEPCAAAAGGKPSVLVTAIVSKIDLRKGRATLETVVGKLELAAAPAELQALQTGDVLTLCVDPAALSGTGTAAPSSRG